MGEAASVASEVVDEWVGTKIPMLLNEFSPSDIYNIDETGLYWKILPDKMVAFKDERVRGGKKSKDRVTALVGASMAGEKLPLFVI